MEKDQPIVLQLKEGSAQNYFKAIHELLGGELSVDSFHFKQGKNFFNGSVFYISDDVEIVTVDCLHTKPIRLDRIPDNNPDFLHLVLIGEGGYVQSYEQSSQLIEAESQQGIFFYNGMFPLVADFPANTLFKSIGFKFSKEALKGILPEAIPQINKMYNSNEGTAFHIPLPMEVYPLIDDIYHFLRGGYGSQTLIKARGLEIFVVVMKAIEKLKGDQLNGLHVDDYTRLMKIKQRLMSSLTGSINVEKIADEFSVSVSKLNRDFKILFNMTIYKFYNHAKMDEAYRRLKTGKYSVTEIGYDLGYNNISKFSEMFKKIKGINPSDVIPL